MTSLLPPVPAVVTKKIEDDVKIVEDIVNGTITEDLLNKVVDTINDILNKTEQQLVDAETESGTSQQ